MMLAAVAACAPACGDDRPVPPQQPATTAREAPEPPAATTAQEAPEPPTSAPVEISGAAVVAELVDRGPAVPGCGVFHVRVVMRYRVKQVLRGDVPAGAEIFVIQGCPELPRAAYRAGSGNLTVFKRGDWHRMTLRPATPEEVGEALDTFSTEPGPRWLPVQTDLARGEGPAPGGGGARR
jgi:hypothetical protein